MMATVSWSAGSVETLVSTELNSLANGSAATAGSAFDNGAAGHMYADFELLVAFGSTPTAGNVVELYLIPLVDGTNDVDSGSGNSEATHYVGAFVLRNTSSATRYYLGTLTRPIQIPPLKFKAKIKNLSGQAMASSGNTLKMVPYRISSA